MQYKETTALHKILGLTKRLKVIQGGSSAGKTIALLLVLINKAQSSDEAKVYSIVAETVPHLKKGAIRDFLNIMEGHGYYKEDRWNRTDFIYSFESGVKIEFFSADNADKVRGPRRDVLFINEANNVSFETYTQLAIRTNEEIYLDYNPVAQFWVHDEVVPKMDHDFLILTYMDNEALAPAIVQEIESRKGNKNFWNVYGLGILGDIEGKIYKDWAIVDEIPHEARLVRRGLDFGYTNDPSVLIDIYLYNGGYILDEVFYKFGMTNKEIADAILAEEKDALTMADSAEPKSIDEIRSYGVNILGAAKGQGSVMQGIQFVQQQRISMTKRSVNLIKCYRNYLWETDKDGKIINEPSHDFSDPMDAVRYGFNGFRGNVSREAKSFRPDYKNQTYGNRPRSILNTL